MHKQNELFSFESFYEKNNDKIEDVNIKQVLLYFDEKEHKEFYKLAKKVMVLIYPKNYKDKNVSDLILNIFKKISDEKINL